MKEKVLTVLVIISLALSVFSLVLTLRATPNIITSVNTDTETLRADSFELKIKDHIGNYGYEGHTEFYRVDNETAFNEDISEFTNVTLISTTAFFNYIVLTEYEYTHILRVQNSFYIIKATFILYCTP